MRVSQQEKKTQNDLHVAKLLSFSGMTVDKGFLAVKTDEKGKVTTANLVAETGLAREFAKNLLGLKPIRAILPFFAYSFARHGKYGIYDSPGP